MIVYIYHINNNIKYIEIKKQKYRIDKQKYDIPKKNIKKNRSH